MDGMHLGSVLVSSACISALFFVSCIQRLRLFDTLSVPCLECSPCLNLQIVSQIMSRLQATSRNQSCVTSIEIRDSWRNRKYIERADILYSVEG